jgi:NAD+-dependent secondary alcohol dehydrogenase Adh1
MKAIRLHAYGEKPRIDEVPEPAVTGPFDVIVRVGGSGLCRTDLHIIEGQWAAKVPVELPYTLGHETAGWVEEVGSAVSNVAVGDAVIVHPLVTCGVCLPCRQGNDMHCFNSEFPGVTHNGGMAELLKTSGRSLIKLPAGVQPADVAAHADAGLTAYHAVKKTLPQLVPGTTVVVLGAGGLGHIGIQCYKALSAARLIVVDASTPALELASKLGADEVVLADGTQVAAVLQLTDGAGAEIVLDFVGERGAENDAAAMTRRGGAHYVVGYGGRIDLPTIDLVFSETSVIGNLVGSYSDLVELVALVARDRMHLHTRTYPLTKVNEAIADLSAGRLQGRGILVP